jgi:septum formation protein
MLEDLRSYRILLASQSPRRKALLGELDIPFRVVEAGHGEEVFPPGLKEGEIARYLAEQKSDDCPVEPGEKEILLTADTIVWQDGHLLGKPADRDEAIKMITRLSDRVHQVFTGVCLRTHARKHSFVVETQVRFSALEAEEIVYYVDGFKPFDKAGAYGIQEWIGHVGVEYIQGSYFNVMGLPVQKVYHELKKLIG